MSDNAVKGIGAAALLGLLSLRACKACDNTADDALKNSDSFFSCNKASKSATDFDPPKTDPSEVSVPSRTEVYQPLSPSQVDQTLNNETSNADESIVVLKKDANNSFTISDNLSQTFKSLNDIDIDNSKVLIVDGDLTTSEIKALNKKGIKFICNKDVYEQQKNIANYEVILIYSEDREILKDLYSINDEQVNDIMEYARPVIADYNIKKIGYESDLEIVISEYKAMDVTPIIVFNNKDNKLFGKSLSEYSISNVITCNSYNFGSDIFFSSTDFIGIKDVMNSLANNKPKNLFEFYKEFSNRYSTFVYNDNKRLVTIVAVGSVAIGGGSGLIIYYNQND